MRTERRDPREVGGRWASFQRHWYAEPDPRLAPFVGYYWGASWDLRGQPPYRQVIVPFPNVHLSFVDDEPAMVHGVPRGHVVKVLAGLGRVVGVAFRPGCFRPFLAGPVSALTDRSVPASDILGPDLPRQPEEIRVVERFLLAVAPPRDPTAEQVAGIVARIADQPELTRVDALAGQLGTGVRRLQRLFAEYVGIGPKRVIRRYRLHEVTERMAAGAAIDWAELAAELGYADQAHLTRDFTALVGESPTRYAERYPATTVNRR
jgi:AraC-like DNA-binding protein